MGQRGADPGGVWARLGQQVAEAAPDAPAPEEEAVTSDAEEPELPAAAPTGVWARLGERPVEPAHGGVWARLGQRGADPGGVWARLGQQVAEAAPDAPAPEEEAVTSDAEEPELPAAAPTGIRARFATSWDPVALAVALGPAPAAPEDDAAPAVAQEDDAAPAVAPEDDAAPAAAPEDAEDAEETEEVSFFHIDMP